MIFRLDLDFLIIQNWIINQLDYPQDYIIIHNHLIVLPYFNEKKSSYKQFN